MKISSLKDLRSVLEKFYKFINSLFDPFSQTDPAKTLGLFSKPAFEKAFILWLAYQTPEGLESFSLLISYGFRKSPFLLLIT